MTEFIKRLGIVLGISLVLAVPVGSIILVNVLWEVQETRAFSATEAIVFWSIMGVWIIVIGVMLAAVLAGMLTDLWKGFKWLFVDPFKSKNTEERFK